MSNVENMQETSDLDSIYMDPRLVGSMNYDPNTGSVFAKGGGDSLRVGSSDNNGRRLGAGLPGPGPGNDTEGTAGDDGYNPYAFGTSPGGGTTDYNPHAVQKEIDSFLSTIKGPMSDYQSFTVMYLMQEYGAQVTGVDANTQNEMTQYFTEIQDAWNSFYSANSPSASGDTTSETSFMSALSAIYNQLTGDSFFDSPATSGMKTMIIDTINSVESTVNDVSGMPKGVTNKLYWLWEQYNGSSSVSTATSAGQQGDPTGVNTVVSQMTQLNSQFTGESQSVGATAKAHMSLWTTEQTVMTNWADAEKKLKEYMAQLQRTS